MKIYMKGLENSNRQVHRLKLIKRQSYGRASFDLFRRGCDTAPGVRIIKAPMIPAIRHDWSRSMSIPSKKIG